MKSLSILNLTLAALASLALSVRAQIEGPPAFIDYQGRVLDSVGDPVAQGSTENIEMYFRIWNHISDALGPNLLWAEKQIVTVADGNFSVRLGEGDTIESSAGDNVVVSGFDDPRPSLLTVFDGSDRFLGVSVAANSTVKPTSEIQPRLAFLTSPFAAVAEKARFAEFGPTSGIFEATAIGVGTSSPGSLLEVTGSNELASDDGGGLISAGSFTGNHIALDADDIQSYSDGATPSTLKLNDHGGDINMGSIGALTTIEGELSAFGGAHGGVFRVVDEAPVGSTQLISRLVGSFGTQGAQMRFEAAGAANRIDVGQNASGDFVVETNNDTSRFVVRQNGRIGIATASPTDTLTIGNTGNISLNGGELRVRADQADGIRWINAAGTTFGRMYRSGTNGRIQMFNSNGGLGAGPYLNPGATDWTAGSDERLKSNIEPLTGILDKIEGIRVVGYNMAGTKVDPKTGKMSFGHARPPRKMKSGKVIKHEIGTIAQDWLEHFPELVDEPQNEDDHYGLVYGRIGVVALGAAQELNAKLKEQEELIKERDEKIADLEARLARLEALISAAR